MSGGPEAAPSVAARCEAARQGVSVAVGDTGDGMAPEALGRVFEPFYSTKTEGAGTGLGLSIVKNIIESHRGDIAVRSTPGDGTVFVVRLPHGA